MAKQKETTNNAFEDSIKNYGKKIEHIESFTEAVRKFPGKHFASKSTARLGRNTSKINSFNCWETSMRQSAAKPIFI